MRILHTSDWHLGKPLEGRSRQTEQEQFIDELCDIAEQEGVHTVLIAGDVFDTYNPPAWAEQLYCYALDRLSQRGGRSVVVVSGNHDSPDRLSAVSPLALNQGIVIAGMPLEQLSWDGRKSSKDRARVVASGAGWVEIATPGCDCSAVIALLPYPSEARLRRVLSEQLSELNIRDAYSQVVGETFSRQTASFRDNTVNIAVSHIFVQGGATSDSERPIEVGGAYTVATEHLPSAAQYIALGHLHRPQQVKKAPTKAYYSGSPLAYSFSEAGYSKGVYLVEAKPGVEAVVNDIPISAGKPLLRWQSKGGLAEVWQRIEEMQGKESWVDLEVHTPSFLTNEEIAKLREAYPGIINVRCILPGVTDEHPIERLSSLSLPEIFRRFYQEKRNGAEIVPELVELFVELANEAATGAEGGNDR